MQSEPIYNLFFFFEKMTCSEVGYRVINYVGDDHGAVKYLQDHLKEHFGTAKRFKLSKSFTRAEYDASARVGQSYALIEELLQHLGAGLAPLAVMTPVKDGELFFNYSSEHNNFDINEAKKSIGVKGDMIDWLKEYTNEKGIDLSKLVHDDYFHAIKLTFNAKLYVSSMKLLLSCIDSIAYIEFGNVRSPTPFISWLKKYADLESLGITAPELWELRNGLLHMTNINSERVRNSTIRRISFRVGNANTVDTGVADDTHYFDFHGLITKFGEALGRWIESYNVDRSKFVKFVERYDETVSDSRVTYVKVANRGSPLQQG